MIRRGCNFKTNLEGLSADMSKASAASSIMDIEDLANMGRREQLCPYFMSRDAAANGQ